MDLPASSGTYWSVLNLVRNRWHLLNIAYDFHSTVNVLLTFLNVFFIHDFKDFMILINIKYSKYYILNIIFPHASSLKHL